MVGRRNELERSVSSGPLLALRVALLGLLPGLAHATSWCGEDERPDSLVLIVADDLGIDRVGCYGDVDARTPNIDRLANQGTRFTTCWAAPRCAPARAMILTGQFPFQTGVGVKSDTLAFTAPTLIDLFPGERGRLVGKWHLSKDTRDPARLGYEHRGSMRNLTGTQSYDRWWKSIGGAVQPTLTYATTDNVDEAIEALGHRIVVVMLNAPHSPFHNPPPHLHSYPDSDWPALRYRAMVEAMDTEIGRLISAIDALPGRRPMILFTSDNGTPGEVSEQGEDPLKMKGTHYEGGLRVPMIARGPGVAAGVVDDRLTSIVDIFATTRDLLDAPGEAPERSVSIFGDAHRRWIYSETFSPNGPGPYTWRVRSIRNTRYKLISKRIPDQYFREFYDLVLDPDEMHNLLAGNLTPEQQSVFTELLALFPKN